MDASSTLLSSLKSEYVHFLQKMQQKRPSFRSRSRWEETLQSKLLALVGETVTFSGSLGRSPFVEVRPTCWGGGLGLFIKPDLSFSTFSAFLKNVKKVPCLKKGTLITTYGGVLYHCENWKKLKRKSENMDLARWGWLSKSTLYFC